jgi:hypothetical protein
MVVPLSQVFPFQNTGWLVKTLSGFYCQPIGLVEMARKNDHAGPIGDHRAIITSYPVIPQG